MPGQMSPCTCGIVRLGAKEVGRNWSENCYEHGVESEWYNSEEQVEKRKKDRDRLRSLQLQAREARKKYLT